MSLRYFGAKVCTIHGLQSGSRSNYLGFSSSLLRFMTTGNKRSVEVLWRDFFSNTSQWWDHRPEKTNPRFPDFKHKDTQESLWLADARNPPWVQEELAAIQPGILQSNVFAWAQRLKRHVKAGEYLKTIEIFHQMQQERVSPDARAFLPILNACAGLGSLEEGKHVHTQIIQAGYESDIYVATCLVDMYAKCGSIEDAWSVFSNMQEHDVVTWNAMIGGYVKSGEGLRAMDLFRRMQREGVEPDAVTYIGVLNACANVAALEEGRRVHTQILQAGCESDINVANCLVDMYAKCGSMEDAWGVFNRMSEYDVVTWSAMIGGYVKSGHGLKAMELFQTMQQEGVQPNTVTFMGVLNACASVGSLEEGRHVHTQITQVGCESDVRVANCLVDMYAKCGSVEDAWSVFSKMREHNVVTWTAMIGACVKSGQWPKAIDLFQEMQQKGVKPDAVTFVGVLNACASMGDFEEGSRVHTQIIQTGCDSDVYVANCLVDMFLKCGSIEDAWSVFNKMPVHNVVVWSAMIAAYVKSGQGLKALELFRRMQREGVEPDAVIFVGALNACASVAALEEGRRLHTQIIQAGCESHVNVATCLVDMYAKCGSIEDAWSVFNKMQEHDVVTWNAMIGGYAMHGQAKLAIGMYERMRKEGIAVNEITFTCLLSACSHGGLVTEGLRYLKSMAACFDMSPTMGHQACMVNLLGRAGRLEEAEELIKRLSLERDVSFWRSLLGACRNHGNIEMAERIAKQCWELDPGNASGCVMLANVYAAAEKWDRDADLRGNWFEREMWKKPGCTWIDINNVVHPVTLDDDEHLKCSKSMQN